MDGLENSILSEISQSHKDKNARLNLCKVSKIVKFMDSEWNGGFQGLKERGKWEILIKGHKISVK